MHRHGTPRPVRRRRQNTRKRVHNMGKADRGLHQRIAVAVWPRAAEGDRQCRPIRRPLAHDWGACAQQVGAHVVVVVVVVAMMGAGVRTRRRPPAATTAVGMWWHRLLAHNGAAGGA